MDETDPTKARKLAKDKLVAAVQKLADGGLWLDRTNQTKGLEHVSNAKLLHLHETLTAIKEKFADRDALIAGIVDVEGRKDDTYKNRFASWPTPRLWDYYKSAAARAEA
ncbi:MAG: hypothetical protein CMN30_27795 [Sandaracinus sp.]|nr:hypothetical protein [Sandaracinus sp.]